MAVHDHTYGHLLQMGVKLILAVRVKVVRVPHLSLEVITSVSQDTMVLLSLRVLTYILLTLSGMVNSVRVRKYYCESGYDGSKYYCESGYDGTGDPSSVLYTGDPLWDGEQCESEGSFCSTAPWFTVDLINPTTDDIEVRICSDNYEDEEDTPIHFLELYIQ